MDASSLGARDAELAVAAAQREGFSADTFTVIYLDIEEGGRMLPPQINYIAGWKGRVESSSLVTFKVGTSEWLRVVSQQECTAQG